MRGSEGGDAESAAAGEFKSHLLEVKSQVVVEGVEQLFIPVPIEAFNLELATCIEQPGPAVWITAPRANNLRLIAVIKVPPAISTGIHLALLSFALRRTSGSGLELERRSHCRPWLANNTPGTPELTSAPLPSTAPRDPDLAHIASAFLLSSAVRQSRSRNAKTIGVFRDTTSLSNRKYTRPMSPRPKKIPCAASVMKRALILHAVHITGMTTSVAPEASDSARWAPQKSFGASKTSDQTLTLMVMDLKASGLWTDVEEDEQKLLLSDPISKQQEINASWLGESITCLLWALRMIPELPSYDQEADPTLTSRLRSASIPQLIRQARLRPKREILKQRQIAEVWNWRARTRYLQEQGRLDDESVAGPTIEQIIERTATRYARFGRLQNAIAGDFQALGKPYRDLSSDEFAVLKAIAQGRHRALNWLCGDSPTGRWADTRTAT